MAGQDSMVNTVTFQLMPPEPPLVIAKRNPHIEKVLNASTVQSITVTGDPWVFFDSHSYGGDFVIYKEGKNQLFPTQIKAIKSVHRIYGGIDSSLVTLYAYPFFDGPEKSFQKDAFQLQHNYTSLKVYKGAVVFFKEENYKGEKNILLNGADVENLNALKLPFIGKSMKIVSKTWP